ncbi:MAG: sigma-70 family RNA polymerase sigma factor [Planctomycetaceae bacterium]|nr:sigma-70 family RNA polymerase sigma factor [Planctomycetaceae bacterium]
MTSDPLYQAVLRYAWRLLGDRELAQDVAQEVYLRRQTQKAIQNERAWAYRTARNLVIDYFRKRDRLGTVEELPDSLPDESTCFRPVDQAQQKEQTEMLHEKLNKLSPRHREAIRLKFQEGLTYTEIAQIMNETVATIGWLLHEAILKLRTELRASGIGHRE